MKSFDTDKSSLKKSVVDLNWSVFTFRLSSSGTIPEVCGVYTAPEQVYEDNRGRDDLV